MEEDEEFGPMMSASDTLSSVEVQPPIAAGQQVSVLLEQKRSAEQEFNRQRARFMELFQLKEEELHRTREEASNREKQLTQQQQQMLQQQQKAQQEVQQLSHSLDEARSALVVAELRKADEIGAVRRELQEELSSLRLIASYSSQESTDDKLKQELSECKRELAESRLRSERLEAERIELKARHDSTDGDDGFLSTITKTLHKRVASAPIVLNHEEESLESSMKKAQHDAEMLRSVVTPLEQEIDALRARLLAYQQLYGPFSDDAPALSPSEEGAVGGRGAPGPGEERDGVDAGCPGVFMDASVQHQQTAGASVRSPPPVLPPRIMKGGVADCRRCLRLDVQLQGAQGQVSRLEEQERRLQEQERRLQEQVTTLQRYLEAERQSAQTVIAYCSELETTLNSATAEAEAQISELRTKAQDSEQFLSVLRQRFLDAHTSFKDELSSMTCIREDLQNELTRLQEENDLLVGKHSKHAQQLQDERINLPNTIEEMQLLVLRCQDEVITTKVAQERMEERLRADVQMLRLQLQEQLASADSMAQHINQLEEELATQNSISSELERQRGAETNSSSSHPQLSALQKQLQQLGADKARLEQTIHEQNVQINAFRTDLSNNESVQQDLISLSQSLQIQLEKVRSGEQRVRWQHPDDCDKCDQCHKDFSATRGKANCWHCGRVHCRDCLARSVVSGPTSRPAPVCSACYTLLVHNSAPYSNASHPPVNNTPD